MVIVYKSNSGYTKEYAKLLSDALDVPAYSIDYLPEVHKGKDILFLGWVFAGSVVGYKKAAKLCNVRCVCAVGMGPPMSELVPGFRAKMSIPAGVEVFYLQGGFDINKLKGPMKLIMKIKVKEIAGRFAGKTDLSPEEQATLNMTSVGDSCVSLENLAPVIDWYKKN
ncbi:MAG: hypothetical protein GX684_02580 [Ruminococcaceae bacterium]|nr:hypothetical protein [Oscillospiraceae bacterium]